MTKLNCNHFKAFCKGMLAGLLCVMVMTCFVRPSYAQSGIGVGFVYTGPHAGGLSVRYKPIQVLASRVRSTNDNLSVDVAVRYNHSVHDWKRVRFKAFGQVDRYGVLEESDFTSKFRFTSGGSAELRIGRKPYLKGLFLTLDIGLSIDHSGNLSNAQGVGIHVFF